MPFPARLLTKSTRTPAKPSSPEMTLTGMHLERNPQLSHTDNLLFVPSLLDKYATRQVIIFVWIKVGSCIA